MFCPNCEAELTGEVTLCPACGTFVAPKDVADDVQTEGPVDVPEEEPVDPDSLDALLADVKETFRLEDASVPAEENPAESEEPAPEAQPEPETSTYARPAPVKEKAPKKAGKAARILVPILAVVLVLAIAGGIFLLASETYDKATECLSVKDYAQAQELYSRFPFFKDSGAQADLLVSQQQAYDNAAQLVQNNSYTEALKGYAALGDYRDSQQLLTFEVPYLQAVYLMENAAAGNADALSQHPAYDEAAADPVEISLYEGVVQLFANLLDYKDSAALSSSSYLHLASAYMNAERFEEALTCQEYMNAADAEASLAEYMTYCADEAVLSDLAKSVRMRYEQESAETEETDLALINAELDILSHYADEELMFYDAQLEVLLNNYIDGLETETTAVGEDGFCEDIVTWYTGRSARCAVVEQLIETYDFLSDDPDLQASFAGKSSYYQAAAAIEEALAAQLVGVTGQTSEDAGDYLVFENTTGYKFSLSISNEYFDEEGESVFFHQTEPLAVAAESTVRIPLLFPEDSDWETWYTGWEYEIELP